MVDERGIRAGAGSTGGERMVGVWIPAFAGMTVGDCSRSSLADRRVLRFPDPSLMLRAVMFRPPCPRHGCGSRGAPHLNIPGKSRGGMVVAIPRLGTHIARPR